MSTIEEYLYCKLLRLVQQTGLEPRLDPSSLYQM